MRELGRKVVVNGQRLFSKNVLTKTQISSNGTSIIMRMSSAAGGIIHSTKSPVIHGFENEGYPNAVRGPGIGFRQISSTPSSRNTTSSLPNQPTKSRLVTSQPWRRAYIAVGSNIGNRVVWIEKALKEMECQGIILNRTSSLWETEPMYVTDQDRFLNGVVEIDTTLSPKELLKTLQGVEKLLGRQKFQEKGPRNIDLDILLYEGQVVNTHDLIVPHLLMLEREFVLRPLAELIPDGTPDISQPQKTTTDFLDALPPSATPMYPLSYLDPGARVPPLSPLNPTRPTHIMGILNLTPDSFSDGGKYASSPLTSHQTQRSKLISESHQQHIETQIASISKLIHSFDNQNTPIIDIGGQSTAPNTPQITAEEEISRVINTIGFISKNNPNYLISIDTYRASVAKAAIEAGAHIVNDVSAGQMDPEMLSTVAKAGRSIVLMHMRGTPATMNKLTDYTPFGLIPTIAAELLERVREAQEAGIFRWRIILDPGIGFAKTAEQNLEILRRFDELRNWPGLKGFPWLVGSSRKGFIGQVTGVKKPEKRVLGSMVAVAAAIRAGADVVRVHDVVECGEVVKMADAIWRVGKKVKREKVDG